MRISESSREVVGDKTGTRESQLFICVFCREGYFLAWPHSPLQKNETVISSLSVSKLSTWRWRKNKVVWVFLLVVQFNPKLWPQPVKQTSIIERVRCKNYPDNLVMEKKPFYTVKAKMKSKSSWQNNLTARSICSTPAGFDHSIQSSSSDAEIFFFFFAGALHWKFWFIFDLANCSYINSLIASILISNFCVFQTRH